jgi:predicted phage terminase large subunit-like protein
MTPSVTDRLSLRDSTRTRDVIQSKWYQDNWGHNFKLDPNVNQKSFWRNNKNGYRLAGGLRGQGIGERFDIGICDDPHKPTEIADSKMKEFVWDWYTGLFSMREAPGGNAKQIIIHQRLATDDLIGRLLEAEPGEWEVLSFPMEFELGQYYTWSDTNILPSRDPRTEQGELLCPQIHDRKAVNTKKKLLGPYGAAAQLQQRPINLEGGIIKSKWLKDYLVGNKTIFLKSMNIIVGSWDLSFGATGNSYCVGQVWGLRNGGEKYLIDQYRGKWEYPQQKAAIKQMLEEYPQIRTLLVEKKANGSAMLSSLERDIRNLRIRNINLIPVEVNKSKEIRLYMCLSDFEAGNVYVPINTQNDKPWTHEYVQELINFPVAKNDDMVDTTTMVLNWFAQNSGLLRQIVMDSEDYKFLQKQDLELQLRPVGRDLVFESSSTRNLFTFTEEQLNLPYF